MRGDLSLWCRRVAADRAGNMIIEFALACRFSSCCGRPGRSQPFRAPEIGDAAGRPGRRAVRPHRLFGIGQHKLDGADGHRP